MSTTYLLSEENEEIWKYAYQGNYNLTHKHILLRSNETMDEMLTSNLIMAYMCYRSNDTDCMNDLFRGIDDVVSKYVLYGSNDTVIANIEDNNKQ